MQMNQVQQGIERVEQCADEAKQAVQQSQSVPNELRQSVETLHQQASQAKRSLGSGQQQGDESRVRDMVMQLEQAGDRAMAACRQAGNVDPQVQQAIQRTHQEASQLKKQVQMG